MKSKEELFKELEELGVTINDYSEKKYLGQNSLGQKFYEGDDVWFFSKKKNYKGEYSIEYTTVGSPVVIEETIDFSEYYKTKQDAYRKMIEYAQKEGEVIELFYSGEWRTSSRGLWWYFGQWNNDTEHPENVYRIQKEKKYRPYTMEDDRGHLRGLWVRSRTSNYEKSVYYMNDDLLKTLFDNYTFLDGSTIGVEI